MIPANQSVFNTVKQLVEAGQQAFANMSPDRKWVCVQFQRHLSMCSNSNGSLDNLREYLYQALLKFCNQAAGAPVYIGLPWLIIKACASNLSDLKKFAMTWSSLPAPFMLDRECFRGCISELFPEHESKVVIMPYDPKHHHAYRPFLNVLVLHLFGLLAKTNPKLDWADKSTQNSLLHHNVVDNFLYYPMGYLVTGEFEDYLLQDAEHQSLVPKAIAKFVNDPKRCTLYLNYDA